MEVARRRRRRGEWVWWRRLGHSPEKLSFVHKMISLDVFCAVFNRQKTRTVTRSLGTHISRINRETKLTKRVQNYQKNHGQTKGWGGRIIATPENGTAVFNTNIKTKKKLFLFYCSCYTMTKIKHQEGSTNTTGYKGAINRRNMEYKLDFLS